MRIRRGRTHEQREEIMKAVKKSRTEDKKKCKEGEHRAHLYPVLTNKKLGVNGAPPKWNKKDVYCRNCKARLLMSNLDNFWQKWVRDCFKLEKELHTKIIALHPPRQYNNAGY